MSLKILAISAVAIISFAALGCPTLAESNPIATVSNEELIGQLQAADLAVRLQSQNPGAAPRLLPLGAPVNIGPRKYPILVNAPAMAELVRRGASALPALLEHLSDARPTQIVFALAPRWGTGTRRSVVSGDDYDCRYPAKDRQPTGVKAKGRPPLGGDGTYRIKVGDLCYVAVGEIVDRNLYVVGWYGGEGISFRGEGLGAKISAIDSPIENPGLAATVRADWGGLTKKEHEQSLLDRIMPSADGNRIDIEAVDRLLFYYPSSGLQVIEDILRHNKYAFVKDELVKELALFHSTELNSELYRVYREAVAAQEADLRTQPTGTWDPEVESLESTLPLDCARLLIHQGHDDEFRAFTLDRIARIKKADQFSPVKPAQNQPAPGIDSLRIVHNYELGCCQYLLAQLDDAPPKQPQPIRDTEEVPKATGNAGVKVESLERGGGPYGPLIVNLGLLEPVFSRVRAARIVVTRARDDVGVILEQQPTAPRFSYSVVGGVMSALLSPSLSISLTSPSRPAKSLAILEGWLEAVVPDLDPFAVVTVDQVRSKVGEPLDPEAFLPSGVSVTVFDKTACERYLREEGPRLRAPGIRDTHFPGEPITERDVAVLVNDEKGRLVSTEFRSRDGSPLRYNHNAWAQYGILPGTQLNLYRFDEPLPKDAQMVCLLATPGALVVAPFKFTNLVLP